MSVMFSSNVRIRFAKGILQAFTCKSSALDQTPAAALKALLMDLPVYTNRMAIEKFNRTRGVPKDGAELVLPDIGQVHKVIGKMFWKHRDRFPIVNVSIVFESPCAVCGALYRYNLPWRLQDRLLRTCEAHRGQFRSPAAPKTWRWKCRPFEQRVAALLLAVVRQFGSIRQTDAVVSIAAQIEPSLISDRDTRKARAKSALRNLIAEGKLPRGIRVTPDAFIWDP